MTLRVKQSKHTMDRDLGPWMARMRIYERDGVEILQTSSPSWVIKIQNSRYLEPKEIDFLRRVVVTGPPIRNMIELPPETDRRFGANWYAMRRYLGSADTEREISRRLWRRLGCGVLNFLEDLHRDHGLVHMDIVLRNILVDRGGDTFVVSDYELVVPGNGDGETPLTCDDDDTVWYYLGAGAELSQPLYTWRTDLVMLGYALADLLRDESNTVTFTGLCERRRQDTRMDMSDYDLIGRRNAEMVDCHPVVRAYLDRVATLVPWAAEAAPHAAVYDELCALFAAEC
jgi:hypothetical protein